MGLRASIYKARGYEKCSNGGVSEFYDQVTLINVPGPSEPSDDAPPALLKAGNLPGTLKVVPVIPGTFAGLVGPMAGGSFIATSDSRFSDACRQIVGGEFYGAVAFHDRYESVRPPIRPVRVRS
jgi:hypothetical protein